MTHIGFTGTRRGMTEKQYLALRAWVQAQGWSPAVTFRHGDCVGADSDAHDLVRTCSHARIVIHPPIKSAMRAFRQGDVEMQPRPYLERNHTIVDASTILLACPRGPEELRSGTWATIRYARAQNVCVVLFKPDGTFV